MDCERSLFERVGGKQKLESLLHYFYADVRQHQVIGPIFLNHVEDWKTHIATITEFWSRLTGGPSDYSGGIAARHLPLNLTVEHFKHWLDLWHFNCRRNLPAVEADEMIALAQQLAGRLLRVVSGQPALTIGVGRLRSLVP